MWITENTYLHHGHERDLATAVLQGALIGMSDGLFVSKEDYRTAAWVFEDTQQIAQTQGATATPVPPFFPQLLLK